MDGRYARVSQSLPASLCQRLDCYVRRVCDDALGFRDAEFIKDCRQEVDVVLWRQEKTWQALPEAEREHYVFACARYVLWHALKQERQRRLGIVLYTDMPSDGDAHEDIPRQAVADSIEAYLALEDWPSGIQDPKLAAAMSKLSPEHLLLLDLHYNQSMTDPEVAKLLNRTVGAVKAQRTRALEKLRRALDCGEPDSA